MGQNNLNPDKVLIFDIKGPMAHFKKYYTNSSSLSYLFPPRTVIVGLIAGLLGMPSEMHTKNKKDIYYEKFSEGQCLVAISIKTKIRRMMQTVNYHFTKTASKKIYFSKHSQIPLEILLPENNSDITYRIYFYHISKIYDELKNRLVEQRFVYPPYLGITEFLASIDHINEAKLSKISKREVELNSVCKVMDVKLNLKPIDKELQYFIEKMPTGFSNDRTPKKTARYLTEIKGKAMMVILQNKAVCYSLTYSGDGCRLVENIMFM